MNRFLAVGFVVAAIVLGLSARIPSRADSAIEVTYLANEGFLLSDGQHNVLIDALIRESLPGYERLPADVQEKLESAQPPFDGVQLVLATHAHADHFSAPAVGRYLSSNTSAVFIGPQGAVTALEKSFPAFDQIRARVHGITPEWKQSIQHSVAGIDVRVLRLKHGDVQNTAFVLALGGKQILHVGDADGTIENFEPFQLADEETEIAFVPYSYLLDPEGQRVLREQMWVNQIVVMHLPVANPEESRLREQLASLGGRAGLLQKLLEAFPDAVLFSHAMETKRF